MTTSFSDFYLGKVYSLFLLPFRDSLAHAESLFLLLAQLGYIVISDD